MIRAETFAKINIGLRVGSLREDGFHPIVGIFQSIDIVDRVALEVADVDVIVGAGGRPVSDGLDNLAFRAASAVRDRAGANQRLRLSLDKAIPAAAGLGGGSADAAAGLAVAGKHFGVAEGVLAELAPQLGSDVPFCLDRRNSPCVRPRRDCRPARTTHRVRSCGSRTAGRDLDPCGFPRSGTNWRSPGDRSFPRPPCRRRLRSDADLRNDLYPAAVALAPMLDDWRADLEEMWGRPVLLSGSGPSLFGFFIDADEAAEAAVAVPAGARFSEPCALLSVGWRMTEDT